jgi:hypothetical protein
VDLEQREGRLRDAPRAAANGTAIRVCPARRRRSPPVVRPAQAPARPPLVETCAGPLRPNDWHEYPRMPAVVRDERHPPAVRRELPLPSRRAATPPPPPRRDAVGAQRRDRRRRPPAPEQHVAPIASTIACPSAAAAKGSGASPTAPPNRAAAAREPRVDDVLRADPRAGELAGATSSGGVPASCARARSPTRRCRRHAAEDRD